MKWLITGGTGFIGCNAAARLIQSGNQVIIFDNLSRKGAESNLEWLRRQGRLEFSRGDVRHYSDLEHVFRLHPDIDVVLHLAGQVAVTTSIIDPLNDFQANAFGTFNMCETVRKFVPGAILLYASTNKVYGPMADTKVIEQETRYMYLDLPNGVSEDCPLDFYSPYGCSKGTGDQYVRDYARIYGLRSVSFRQSCIYGRRQYGIEDQGWVAWFTIAAMLERPVTICGDGKQVRDILFVDDLIECYLKAVERIDRVSGQVYNIGGGPRNTISLLELIQFLDGRSRKKMQYSFADWRKGDQRVFFCDISKANRDFGWKPNVTKDVGLAQLVDWVSKNRASVSLL
jgi:CDP-paratose 2-epimerase